MMERSVRGDHLEGTDKKEKEKREEEPETAEPQGQDQAGGEGSGEDYLEASGGIAGERTRAEPGHHWANGEEEAEVAKKRK